MRKGSIVGQVFIFILAGLVFVLILTYGYKAIQGLISRSEEVAVVDFKSDFQSAVENIKRNYRSRREFDLRLPSQVEGVCVVDVNNCPDTVMLELPSGDRQIDWVVDACKTKSANVFLIPRSVDFFVPDITIENPYYVCIHRDSSLGLEGLGRSAKVFAWK